MYINKRGNKEYKPLWTIFKHDTKTDSQKTLFDIAISSNVSNYPRIAHLDFTPLRGLIRKIDGMMYIS